MSSENQQPHDVQSVIASLHDAISRIDKDDLRLLAKMHGWCETLMELTREGGECACPDLHDRVGSIVRSLETLILDDVDDADATLASVTEKVRALAGEEGSSASGDACDSTRETAEGDGDAQPAGLVDDEVCSAESGGDVEVPASASRTVPDESDSSPAPQGATRPASDVGKEPSPSSGAETVCRETGPQNQSEADMPGASKPVSDEGAVGDPAPTESSAEPQYVSEPLFIDGGELDFVKGFVEEANEHIEAIESAVLEVERVPSDAGKIDDLFRPFHTIKGMAGFLNLRDVNSLTHEVETLLDQGRKGKRAITPGLIDLVFDVVDILRVQVKAIGDYLGSPTGEAVPQPSISQMIALLRDVVAGRIEPGARDGGSGRGAQKIGENLVEQGAVPQEVVDFALDSQASREPEKKVGEILVDAKAATPKAISKAIRPQAQAQARATGVDRAPSKGVSVGDQSIRIETNKLDSLVDMVGELVIAQTLVSAHEKINTDPKLTKDVGQVTKIVRDVQEAAMSLRMIPIGATFQKMARLVRDVARKAGKTVELHISGEDTELDKNVIQQIGDPLVHMVRNAVDHGIEPPQERRVAGKLDAGHVYLSAFHHGGNIVIEIRDDGKGLDSAKLIAKAAEKGMISPGEELSDQEAYQLVFAPGFSLAKEVTDISGRGVGMDVVKRNIEQLRGRVEISSEKGRGSTFSIRLPLTLAIIDGMIVRVGSERFIFQTIVIEQALRPQPEQITTVQRRGEMLQVRGRLIPLVQLGERFGLTGRVNPCENMVVIASCEGGQIGVVVEELIGQQQVVIKSLGERFEKLRGISGGAILGDGRVGLILEMEGLQALHESKAHPTERERPRKTEIPDSMTTPSAEQEDGSAAESQSEPELVLT